MLANLLSKVVIRLSGQFDCLLWIALSLNRWKSERREREYLHVYATGIHRCKATFTHVEQLRFNRFDPFSHHRVFQQSLKLRRRARRGGSALDITHMLCVLRGNEVLL